MIDLRGRRCATIKISLSAGTTVNHLMLDILRLERNGDP